MKVFHRTPHGLQIIRKGFRDNDGHYMANDIYRGVWFSDWPLSDDEGAFGDWIFYVEIPDEVLAPFEWVEELGCKGYRKFLVPASVVNKLGPPILCDEFGQRIQTEITDFFQSRC